MISRIVSGGVAPAHIAAAMAAEHFNSPPINLREVTQGEWLHAFSTTVSEFTAYKQVNVDHLPEGALRERFAKRGYISMYLWGFGDGTGLALGIVYENADPELLELARLVQEEALKRNDHGRAPWSVDHLYKVACSSVEERSKRGEYIGAFHHVPVWLAFGCEHAFRGYDAKEAQEKGWTFTHGRCLHHNVCTKCGAFNNYDSSD